MLLIPLMFSLSSQEDWDMQSRPTSLEPNPAEPSKTQLRSTKAQLAQRLMREKEMLFQITENFRLFATQHFCSNIYTSVWTNTWAPQLSQADTLIIWYPTWESRLLKHLFDFSVFCTTTYWVLQILWESHTKSETHWAMSEPPTQPWLVGINPI